MTSEALMHDGFFSDPERTQGSGFPVPTDNALCIALLEKTVIPQNLKKC